MKGWIFMAAMLFTMQASAQFYEPLRYRANDPFVFCTQGQQTPTKCWWPIAPYTGAYLPDLSCDPPNEYGRPWTSADYDSLDQYLTVCPMAQKSGAWNGTAPAESSPFEH
ncbi:hypothetical protein [Dyella silvatica]|uniref:hypothetical protein n=1 Tax=Dyella silvatica TaxID=2992128 RepID=UPI00225950C3|nr:hypothetical protein [Dyella silvatica]